jgi:hypothetical protein
MTKLKLALLGAFIFLGFHAFASPPTVYVSPGWEIRFANGAAVAVYQDRIVLIEPNGQRWVKRRPLPDRARNPNGCAWLRQYLNTTSPYTRDWGDACLSYLETCREIR